MGDKRGDEAPWGPAQRGREPSCGFWCVRQCMAMVYSVSDCVLAAGKYNFYPVAAGVLAGFTKSSLVLGFWAALSCVCPGAKGKTPP